jgi:hypothetical protein
VKYAVVYVAGMGLTNPSVASGTALPSTNLPALLDAPTLTLGGVPVTDILFAGLTPTLVGLCQIDFQVPAAAPNGDLPLVLTQTSGLSNSTILPVPQLTGVPIDGGKTIYPRPGCVRLLYLQFFCDKTAFTTFVVI